MSASGRLEPGHDAPQCLIITERSSRPAAHPEPSQHRLVVAMIVLQCDERLRQPLLSGRLVALNNCDVSVQEQIADGWSDAGRKRQLTGCGCDVRHALAREAEDARYAGSGEGVEQRVSRRANVERCIRLCCVQQEPDRAVDLADRVADVAFKAVASRPLVGIRDVVGELIENSTGTNPKPGDQMPFGSGQGALGAGRSVRCQFGGASEERGRCGATTPKQGSFGSFMQFCGDRFIGVGGRRPEVPRSPVRIAEGAAGLGEDLVGAAAIDDGRPAVDRRSHERVAEAKPFAANDHGGCLGRVSRVREKTQRGRGRFDQRSFARRFSCRDEQHRLRVGRQSLHLAQEVRLEAPAEGKRSRPQLVGQQLMFTQSLADLEQCHR